MLRNRPLCRSRLYTDGALISPRLEATRRPRGEWLLVTLSLAKRTLITSATKVVQGVLSSEGFWYAYASIFEAT